MSSADGVSISDENFKSMLIEISAANTVEKVKLPAGRLFCLLWISLELFKVGLADVNVS